MLHIPQMKENASWSRGSYAIQAISSYAMACFSLSQKFCNKLTQYVKRFWWSMSPEDAKSIGLVCTLV
ncbi:hypothetical protein RHGRI_036753 [Rhododendron griersonianum]|uniref:Uncharacterized protein n=1 Tax=Rhododendron griersonianum TaxID=479676 RepID=A0AAV6HP30_9ERIC|nr:hypothetical protein RHGRI_036753 [Rhododendron griersonianum]